MTTTYISGTVNHPTQADAERASLTKLPVRESIGEGSIVTLKQGGPSMVVLARSTREALVAWHNDTGDLFEKMLPLIALKVKT